MSSPASLAAVPSRRINRRALRTLGGLAIAAGALLANVWFWGQAQHTDPVLVLTRDLAAGQQLTAADLGRREMRLAPETRALAVPAAELAAVLDRPTAGALRAGTLLTRDRLAVEPVPAAGQVTVAVGLTPELTPPLAPGSRVDVIGLNRAAGAGLAGGATADQAVLARGALVQSVTLASSGLAGSALGGTASANARVARTASGVVLVVAPHEAGAVLSAAAGPGVALALLPATATGADATPPETSAPTRSVPSGGQP
jgi:Flp pilus assembly protein CpaB